MAAHDNTLGIVCHSSMDEQARIARLQQRVSDGKMSTRAWQEHAQEWERLYRHAAEERDQLQEDVDALSITIDRVRQTLDGEI